MTKEAEKIRECLRDYTYTSNGDWDELFELERLARIGMATIKAFDACRNSVKIKIYDSKIEFSSVEELLEWAEGDEQ